MKFKILIDENLSRKLSASFSDALFESVHVSLKNLLKVNDRDIWNFAYQEVTAFLQKIGITGF